MRRKRLWIALGIFCAFAVAIGYLARPEDPYAKIRELHPEEAAEFFTPRPNLHTHSGMVRKFWFRAPLKQVEMELPPPEHDIPGIGKDYNLRAGDEAELLYYNPNLADPDAITCELEVFEVDMPWYQRAWATLKHRLGL